MHPGRAAEPDRRLHAVPGRQTVNDLNKILAGLRAAGGRKVRIIGMNYYVPELAGWFDGKPGKEIAVLTERLVDGYNSLLVGAFRHYHVRVANVFAAFHSGDFTDHVRRPGIGRSPATWPPSAS